MPSPVFPLPLFFPFFSKKSESRLVDEKEWVCPVSTWWSNCKGLRDRTMSHLWPARWHDRRKSLFDESRGLWSPEEGSIHAYSGLPANRTTLHRGSKGSRCYTYLDVPVSPAPLFPSCQSRAQRGALSFTPPVARRSYPWSGTGTPRAVRDLSLLPSCRRACMY